MKKLSELLAVPLAHDCAIGGLAQDSREVKPGDLFLAFRGQHFDGERFIGPAIQAGAVAVLVEGEAGEIELRGGVPCIPYPDLTRRAGELAARFYDDPTRAMQVIGVTGTNGKTSISHFLAQSLPAPCGLLGTLGYGIYGQLRKGAFTTPFAPDLQQLFHALRQAGVSRAVMEVSSHGLDQGRVAGVHFETAIFTNLSRDHLDYHGSMEQYGAAKRKLFHWPGLKRAVINLDDAFGRELLTDLPPGLEVLRYSLDNPRAEIHCRRITPLADGYELAVITPWGETNLRSPLWGHFNLSNLLATLAMLVPHGSSLAQASQRLSALSAVPGRLEHYARPGSPRLVIDYAHTPDALEKVLSALREHCQGKLWCVFGCGGERDAGKRPLMGELAERLADRVIVTDDNPRGEDPAEIIAQILAGMSQPEHAWVLADRRQAITYAFCEAAAEDVILIAGKGAEETQHIGDRLLPFSDRRLAAELTTAESA
jgi:UDP-N-acetylmuramoyl-L-alanyl-D-glutamate--2,6-diaminopimelate ligase